MSQDRHIFLGMQPYVEQAAKRQKITDGEMIDRAKNSEPLDRIANAISQACDAPPEHRADMIQYARYWRNILKLSLDAADAMLTEIPPKILPKPAPKTEDKPAPKTEDKSDDTTKNEGEGKGDGK